MRNRAVYRKRKGGFTLMEVVIAALILAIVITGIAAFFMHIINASDSMDDRTRALELCREGIENLRTQDVVSMSDGWQSPPVVIDKFTRDIEIGTPYTEYPEAKLIECRVTWTGIDGADTLSLGTIF